MPISVDMMKAAAESGLSIVCASCEKYWGARQKGVPGDVCMASGQCGSPLAKDDFHEYKGVMTEDAFKSFCFVCGSPPVARLRKEGGVREIGVCKEHVEWMRDADMRSPAPALFGVAPRPTKAGTLIDEILKTEEQWAEEDGREFDPKEVLDELGGKTSAAD